MIRTNSPAENWKDHDWPSAPTQRSVRVEPSANRVWISSNSTAAADAFNNSLVPVARPFLQCPTEGLAKYPLSDRCMRRIRGESITAVSTTQTLSTNPPSRLSQNERHDAGGLRVASHVIVKRWEGMVSSCRPHTSCFGRRSNPAVQHRRPTGTAVLCTYHQRHPGDIMPRQIIGRRPDSLHERRRALPRPSDSLSRHPPPVTIPGAQRMLSGIFSTLKRNCQLIHACSAGQHGKTPDSLHLPIPSLD